MFSKVWGKGFFGAFAPRNDNIIGQRPLRPQLPPQQPRAEQDVHWLNAKALYDEAHEHLKLYETLYAKAHAIDLACRRRYAGYSIPAGNGGQR